MDQSKGKPGSPIVRKDQREEKTTMMKTIVRKGLSLVLVLSMMLSLCAISLAEEKEVLTVWIPAPEETIDLPTNEVVKWLEEQTSIHIDWQIVDSQSQNEQLNLLLSSGVELPDIILCDFSAAQLIQYGSEGILTPINDLLDQYGENAKAFIKAMTGSDDWSVITAPDGNIYSMPVGEACYHCTYSQKMWINQKWLDQLELPTPTTTDEFYQTLIAFRDKDPNQNGIADEIPLSACINWWHSTPENFLMNAFIYSDDDSYLCVDDGKVMLSAIQPEWREGLLYLKKLYDEGLLDSEAFVQTPEQLRQLAEGMDAVMLGAAPTGTPAAFADDNGEVTKDFVALSPLTGPNGYRTTAYYSNEINTRGVVTKDCKNPALAVRWLDFLLSEDATMRQVFGVKGVDWVESEAGKIGLDGGPALFKEIVALPSLLQHNEGAELLPGMTERLFNGREIDENDIWYIEYRLAKETKDKYDIGIRPEEVLHKVFMTLDDSKTYDEVKERVTGHIRENIAKFVTGARDIDQEWDLYVEEIQNLGAETYVNLAQKYYTPSKQ